MSRLWQLPLHSASVSNKNNHQIDRTQKLLASAAATCLVLHMLLPWPTSLPMTPKNLSRLQQRLLPKHFSR